MTLPLNMLLLYFIMYYQAPLYALYSVHKTVAS